MARMDSTLLAHYSAVQQFAFVPGDMYAHHYPASPAMSQASSSFGRSPAQQTHPLPTASPRHFYHGTYDQPATEVFTEDDYSTASSSNSNGVSQETHYQYATTPAGSYGVQSIPRNMAWPKEEPIEYNAIPAAAIASHLPHAAYGDTQGFTFFEPAPPEMPPYYEAEPTPEPTLSAYAAHAETLPSVLHRFSHSPRVTHLSRSAAAQAQSNPPSPAFSAASPARLHYPPSPQQPPSQFVSLQDVSPSPTVSPDQPYSTLPAGSPAAAEYPAEYTLAAPATPATPSSVGYDACATPTPQPARKRRRPASDDEEFALASESGESEKEDSDDEEYRPVRRRRVSARTSATREVSPADSAGQRARVAAPVPVPNLTKKSRGRQVPTTAMVVRHNGVEKNVRSYLCKVPGCNKYFQRGEHLKRHVRSIHTNEKPHKCPYRSCGKDFSRHDNLRQHMRVHRHERLDSEETSGSA